MLQEMQERLDAALAEIKDLKQKLSLAKDAKDKALKQCARFKHAAIETVREA